MRTDNEPALAPSADSQKVKAKRMTVGKGLVFFFLAFAGLMFTLYAIIILWTGMTAAGG
jgi:hypothetical protein